ncbi:Uncharacterised protein [Mycobacteroides abscessus]|nr:Uncharacterised protein [Mycobacteroides abscessus]
MPTTSRRNASCPAICVADESFESIATTSTLLYAYQ